VACCRHEPYCCEQIPALKFAGCRADGTQPLRLDNQGITSAFFQQSSFASHAIALEQALIPVGHEEPAGVLAAFPCGVQTGAGAVINTFQAAAGDGLLVIGAGTVGLSAVMAAKLVGMDPIVCVEPHASRRALALQLGATQVEESWHHGTASVRYALDTSATVAGLETAIDGICKGGTVGIVSYPDDGEPFPFTTKDLFMKVGRIQAVMQGSSVPREFLPQLIEYWRVGRFPVDRLVTTYSFADIDRAFADMRAGDTVKAVLLMG
jgi:aryl-alcohol dehydrogenase